MPYFPALPVNVVPVAGTGKSVTLNKIIEFCESKGIKYGVTATTGTAAFLIGGKTLHSFLGIGLAKETTKETKTEKAVGPKSYGFNPQKKVAEYKADFQHNSISYVFEDKEIYGIDQAVTNLYTYLKDKDPKIAVEYPKSKLKSTIQKELKDKGYGDDYLSKENYHSEQQAFGPMFREIGKEVPRVSNVADDLFEISTEKYPTQSFSEDSLKRNGFLIYTESTGYWYKAEDHPPFQIGAKEFWRNHSTNFNDEYADGDDDDFDPNCYKKKKKTFVTIKKRQ